MSHKQRTKRGAFFLIAKNTAQAAVMSSVVEAKLDALYINAKLVAPLHQTLQEMGHPQPMMSTPTDNSTAYVVITQNNS